MDWVFSDLYLGFGASASMSSFLSCWAEYTHTSMGLAYGDFWQNQADKSHAYHQTNLGVEANLHAIPVLHVPSTLELYFRISYFNLTCNSGIDPFQSREFGPLLPLTSLSRSFRYNAVEQGFGWGTTERISGFVLGAGSFILNRSMAIDTRIGFLNQSLGEHESGIVFGANVGYMLR